ncbi:hypothetical protein HY625_00980 [Candidatus Uhrbacteria bacterium]|nr:hypothetical protein [Candidatus Uhrbacteria bacterium]
MKGILLMQRRIRNYFALFLLLSSFLLGSAVFAQSLVIPLDPSNVVVSPGNEAPKSFVSNLGPACLDNGNCTFCDVLKVFATIMQWILSTVAGLSLFFVIYGGFDLLTSGGNSEKVDAGKKKIGGSIIGLIIVLGSYLVINAIIFMFTENKTNIPNFNPTTWSTFDCEK